MTTIVCWTHCWPCMVGSCFETPNLHPWWDDEDIEHAANTGQDPPTGWCGCRSCGWPAVEARENR